MTRFRGRGVFPRGVGRLITERDSKEQKTTSQGGFFLVATAERLLKESDVYNSPKHGMSVLPGDRGMKYGDDDFPIDLSMNGPSLAYLEMQPNQPQAPRKWAETTTWVQLDGSLASIRLVTQQMRNLWSIAGLIYLTYPRALIEYYRIRFGPLSMPV